MRPLLPNRNAFAIKWLVVLCSLLLIALCVSAAPAPRPVPPGKTAPAVSKKKKKAKKTHASKRRVPLQSEPDAARTNEIQSALARGGYYQGDPTGKWDGDTVAAVQKFQSANGLDASGKLDAPTLQKLGLGSEIAGVSAPKPPSTSPPPSASLSATPAGGSVAAPATPAPAASIATTQ